MVPPVARLRFNKPTLKYSPPISDVNSIFYWMNVVISFLVVGTLKRIANLFRIEDESDYSDKLVLRIQARDRDIRFKNAHMTVRRIVGCILQINSAASSIETSVGRFHWKGFEWSSITKFVSKKCHQGFLKSLVANLNRKPFPDSRLACSCPGILAVCSTTR